MEKRAVVLGGDRRQIELAQLLLLDGWEVVTWGLDQGNAPAPVSLDKTMEADVVILPLPVCRNDMLNLPLSDTVLKVDDLWRKLRAEQMIFGGMTASAGVVPKHLRLFDYFDREEVQVANAVPTAEGAIMRAMEETESTLCGSKCLVIGFGRIGKILAHLLRGLGAEVTVSARKHADIAWIKAYGYRAVRTDNLTNMIGEYNVVFNTVPAVVLKRAQLSAVRRDCLLMELASQPGGIDANAVKELGLRVVEEKALPGKFAPKSAAVAIRDGINHILEEEGIRL